MNVVDSSGWLEYFADGPNATFFAAPIANVSELVVPSISIYEVFKKILATVTEEEALDSVAVMMTGKVIDLNAPIAVDAAALSLEFKLPMADRVILATSRAYKATLWTQDFDFRNIEGVRYIAKR